MELELVREFIAITETLNYRDASDRTGVSAPVLTRHIKKLENELGVTLFDRNTRRVFLSEHGELFLPYARMLIQTQDISRQALLEHIIHANNQLRIGTMSISRAYGIMELIANFHRNHPELRINVFEGDSDQLKLLLQNGEYDLVFARDDTQTETHFNRIPFVTDSLAALLPVNHPLSTCTPFPSHSCGIAGF